jgi:hypothetical protein
MRRPRDGAETSRRQTVLSEQRRHNPDADAKMHVLLVRLVSVQRGTRNVGEFAEQAAASQRNAVLSRGLTPNSTLAAKLPKDVELSRRIPPDSKPFADPHKVLRIGPFDWQLYQPIEVETDDVRYCIVNGMTRLEAARRAGITELPPYIFKR